MHLTVIIVEYHSRPHLDALLDSLAHHEPAARILVSSNSSYSPAKWRQLEQDFPNAQFVWNPGNLGYARAVNAALQRVETPYTAILNPDVEVTRGLAEPTQAVFEAHPTLAVFGPRVLDAQGRQACSFRRFYPPWYILARYLLGNVGPMAKTSEYYLMQETSREHFTHADWVSGGAMFIRMNAYRQVGGMDERYFLYMEDMDWCRSFWLAGWEVAYVPEIRVVHRAQHEGTRRGVLGVFSQAARRQLASYFKYVLKWGLRNHPIAESRALHFPASPGQNGGIPEAAGLRHQGARRASGGWR